MSNEHSLENRSGFDVQYTVNNGPVIPLPNGQNASLGSNSAAKTVRIWIQGSPQNPSL